jgi:hypothetical protein
VDKKEHGMKVQTWLKQTDACSEGAEWAKDKASFKEVWDSCQRPDWMLWGLARIGYKDERKLRLYGCACVRGTPITKGRTVWDLLKDERSRKAVEVSERFANGEATEEERDAAGDAARDAAWDAAGAAARAAAWAAAWDAAGAAARDAARAAAGDAARDAAWDAARAAARAAAWAAAWDAARVWQADELRELVPWIEVEKAIRNRKRKPKP